MESVLNFRREQKGRRTLQRETIFMHRRILLQTAFVQPELFVGGGVEQLVCLAEDHRGNRPLCVGRVCQEGLVTETSDRCQLPEGYPAENYLQRRKAWGVVTQERAQKQRRDRFRGGGNSLSSENCLPWTVEPRKVFPEKARWER